MGREALSGDDTAKRHRFDLEERTAVFGENILKFAKRIPTNAVTEPLRRQLVKAATSIGANYCEADDAFSKKEFRYRIGICRKESRETKFWLRMIAAAEPDLKSDARTHWDEARQLHLIFVSILKKSKPSTDVRTATKLDISH